MTYAIVTFGCRVNTADSLAIEAALRRNGATPAPAEAANLVIVNTCSVTATADQGARQLLPQDRPRQPVGAHRRDRVLCLGANPTISRSCLASPRWSATTRRSLRGSCPCSRNSRQPNARPPRRNRAVHRWSVRSGPAARLRGPDGLDAGRPDWVRREVQLLRDSEDAGRWPQRAPAPGNLAGAARGHARLPRIVLTGVHLGSYGRDIGPAVSLAGLMRRLADVADAAGVRLRLSSIEPMDCTDELIDVVAGASPIAPHFHVPLQHASDRVLAAMRRPYNLAHYHHVVSRIRARLPDAAIGADVMVGVSR